MFWNLDHDSFKEINKMFSLINLLIALVNYEVKLANEHSCILVVHKFWESVIKYII